MQTGTRLVPSGPQEALGCCAGDGVPAQAAQGGCGISSSEIFRSLLDVALVEQADPGVPSHHSVTPRSDWESSLLAGDA